MAFAGLWEGYSWPDATAMRTFAIVTTYVNETVGEPHDPMPFVLEPQDRTTWLGAVEGDPAALLRPFGDEVPKVGLSAGQ
jgi:putative SOS response-associated peptidase YedK